MNDEDFEAVIEGIEEDFVESEKLLEGAKEVDEKEVGTADDVGESDEGGVVVVSDEHSTEGSVPGSSNTEILQDKTAEVEEALSSAHVDSDVVAIEAPVLVEEHHSIPEEVGGESFVGRSSLTFRSSQQILTDSAIVDVGNTTDVVIDYEEVFDENTTVAPSPLLAPTVPTAKGEPPALTSIDSNVLSPKRSHSSLRQELSEDGKEGLSLCSIPGKRANLKLVI